MEPDWVVLTYSQSSFILEEDMPKECKKINIHKEINVLPSRIYIFAILGVK